MHLPLATILQPKGKAEIITEKSTQNLDDIELLNLP